MGILTEQTPGESIRHGRQLCDQCGPVDDQAKRAGAPKGNKNAWKHGFHSKQAIAQRRQAKRVLIESRGYLKDINDNDDLASLLSNNLYPHQREEEQSYASGT